MHNRISENKRTENCHVSNLQQWEVTFTETKAIFDQKRLLTGQVKL